MAQPDETAEQALQRARKAADDAEKCKNEAQEHESAARSARESAEAGILPVLSLIVSGLTMLVAGGALWVACSQLGQARTDQRVAIAASLTDRVYDALARFQNGATDQTFKGIPKSGATRADVEQIEWERRNDLATVYSQLLRAKKLADYFEDEKISGEYNQLRMRTCETLQLYDGALRYLEFRAGPNPSNETRDFIKELDSC